MTEPRPKELLWGLWGARYICTEASPMPKALLWGLWGARYICTEASPIHLVRILHQIPYRVAIRVVIEDVLIDHVRAFTGLP